MKEIYTVYQCNTGADRTIFVPKEFSTYQLAIVFIEDMFKYHKLTFRIEKSYTNKE